MPTLMDAVVDLYRHGASQREIAAQYGISAQKVRKLLITAGLIETREAQLLAEGLTPAEIGDRLRKSPSGVSANLPYTKGEYDAAEPTVNALRIRASRARKMGGERDA